jgi:hypothetical protein
VLRDEVEGNLPLSEVGKSFRGKHHLNIGQAMVVANRTYWAGSSVRPKQHSKPLVAQHPFVDGLEPRWSP